MICDLYKCCHLVSEHEAYDQRLCTAAAFLQFPIYTTFVVVMIHVVSNSQVIGCDCEDRLRNNLYSIQCYDS